MKSVNELKDIIMVIYQIVILFIGEAKTQWISIWP